MQREDRKRSLFYPENRILNHWDLLMTMLLILSCLTTPMRVAFILPGMQESQTWEVYGWIVDFLFFADILVIFHTAYQDEYLQTVDDRKLIAKRYLTGWFIIDFVAIFPFQQILEGIDLHSLVRITRIGRLYKLVKLAKLVRLFKFIRNKSKFLKLLNDMINTRSGFQRLFFFCLVSMMLMHIITCFWIILPQLLTMERTGDQPFYEGTWIAEFYEQNYTDGQVYSTSLYWTIQTITTVGYGGISGTLIGERIFSIITMLIGVFAFTFANGSLASILSSYDVQNAELNEKITVLKKIYDEYKIPPELFINCKKHLEHDSKRDLNDIEVLLSELTQQQ